MTLKTWIRRRWSGAPAAPPAARAPPFDDGLVELARLIAVDDPVKAEELPAVRSRFGG